MTYTILKLQGSTAPCRLLNAGVNAALNSLGKAKVTIDQAYSALINFNENQKYNSKALTAWHNAEFTAFKAAFGGWNVQYFIKWPDSVNLVAFETISNQSMLNFKPTFAMDTY